MTKTWLLSMLIAAAFSLGGCVRFKASLCPPEFRADIPNFEGRYLVTAYDTDKLETYSSPTTVVRIEPGHYRFNSSDTFVCLIDNHYIFETKNADGEYELSGIERRSDGGFNAILYAMDVRSLQKHHIPYQVVEKTKDPRLERFVPPGSSLNRAVVVDNTNVNSQLVLQLIDPLSARIAFSRAP